VRSFFCFSLSRSTLSMSSGSSLGSLTSTGSQSSVAASLSDIYFDPCHPLSYELPEIDRESLFQRVEHLLKGGDSSSSCSAQFDDGMSGTVPSRDVCCSGGANSSAGCLPTYEQHLERQRCIQPSPQADGVDLTKSLQGLNLGPFTSRLIASASNELLTESFSANDGIAFGYQLQPPLADVTPFTGYPDVQAAHSPGYVCLGQSDASSGVSGEDVGGAECTVGMEVNCGMGNSRHVSSGSVTESDSGICEASLQQ